MPEWPLSETVLLLHVIDIRFPLISTFLKLVPTQIWVRPEAIHGVKTRLGSTTSANYLQ